MGERTLYDDEQDEIYDKVLRFFNGNTNKTNLWFTTLNPMLGGVTPNSMMNTGRGHKLKKFIQEAEDITEEFLGGLPPTSTETPMPKVKEPKRYMGGQEFHQYDMVVKNKGDYTFRGTIIAVMQKVHFYDDGDFEQTTGKFRYAVQNTEGLIHILSASQIELDGGYQWT